MATLKLTRGAEARIKAGHPWIYRTQIADLTGRWKAEEAVEIVDWSRRFLGRGFYNPRPSLCCRLLTRRDEPVDAGFFHRRLREAFEYRREAGLASDAYRLVWSEADGLPGLVVDRYGAVSVVQCLTLGMSRAAPAIADGLHRLFPEGRVHRLVAAGQQPTAERGARVVKAAAEEAAGPVHDLDGLLGLPPAREIGDLGAVDPRVAGLDPLLGSAFEN